MKKSAQTKNLGVTFALALILVLLILVVGSLAIPYPKNNIAVTSAVGTISNECMPQYGSGGGDTFCCIKGSILNTGNMAAYRIKVRANFYKGDVLMEGTSGTAGSYTLEPSAGRNFVLPITLRNTAHPDVVRAGCNSNIEAVPYSAEYAFQYYIKRTINVVSEGLLGRKIFY